MPAYDFTCPKCKDKDGEPRITTVVRPMSQSGDPCKCDHCGTDAERVYSFSRKKEFMAYQDEQYGCEISSERQERALMKKHRHVPFRETPAYDKFRSQIRRARKKPMYFTSAGGTKMERD